MVTAFGTGTRTYGVRSVLVYNKPAEAAIEVADDSDVNVVASMNFDSVSGCPNSYLYLNITVDSTTAVKRRYYYYYYNIYYYSDSAVNLDFVELS